MRRQQRKAWAFGATVLILGGIIWWSIHERRSVTSFPVGDGSTEEVVDILELEGAKLTIYLGTSLAKHISPEEFKKVMEQGIGTVATLQGVIDGRILFLYRAFSEGEAASHFGMTEVRDQLTIVTIRDADVRLIKTTLVHELSHAFMKHRVAERGFPQLMEEGFARLTEGIAFGKGSPQHEELIRNKKELSIPGAFASWDGSMTSGIDELQSFLAGELFLELWEKSQGRAIASMMTLIENGKLATWQECRDFCHEILGENHPIFFSPRKGTYAMQLAYDLATEPKEIVVIFRRGEHGDLLPMTLVGVSDMGKTQEFPIDSGVFAIDMETLQGEFPSAESVMILDEEETVLINVYLHN